MSSVVLVWTTLAGERVEAILEPGRRRRGVVITHTTPDAHLPSGNKERPLTHPHTL